MAEGRACATAPDPRLAFFRLYKRLSESGFLLPDVEPGRGVDCDVHASAMIADLTSIGDRVTIGPGAIVLDGSIIGDDTFIAPGAIIGAEGMITIDDENQRLRIPHAGGTRLGRNVQVLSQAVIARSLFRRFTDVGDEAQIGIQTTIGHGARIGRRCVIRGNSVISGRAIVEDGAVVSLSSCVADARRVGKGASVMMGSVVVADVEAGAMVSGNFAYDHREHVNDYIRRTR
jgi:UDP-3-O-[3-hydroxymyristoyl] glucosamine N-acyltransferase